MSTFSKNYWYTIGVMFSVIFLIGIIHIPAGTAIIGGVVAMVLLGLYRGLQALDFDCPRMIMGYNCHGKTCDHSPKAVASAKAALRQR